jgi:DNA-binding transcriptional ArsR family regulator
MKPTPKTTASLLKVLTGVGQPTRLRIFKELFQNGPSTGLPLANKLGLPLQNVSKHLLYLRKIGLLEQGMGRVYSIPERFRVPGQQALDFGHALVRFDHPNS